MSAGNDRPARDAADRALRQMGTAVVPVEDRDRALARRARLLPALSAHADQVFAASPRRSLPAYLAMAALLATVALAGVGFRLSRRARERAVAATPTTATVRASAGAVRVFHEGTPANVSAGAPIGLGARDRVATGAGRAEVRLASGALVELESKSDLELAADDRTDGAIAERVDLDEGRISVHVPKLSPGGRLVVGTPQAVVTVHGTTFAVEVHRGEADGATRTTVSVTEGRVSVASNGREIFLGPGAQWTSLPPVSDRPEAKQPVPAAAAPAAAPAPAPKSTLAEENALFRSAIARRRAGDPRAALDLLDRLLSTYPTTPLGAEVRAERARALSDLGSRQAP